MERIPLPFVHNVKYILHFVNHSIHAVSARPRSALLLSLALAACWDDPGIGTPLSIELIGPETGRVSEELAVRYEVTGRQLVGIIFDWGDGASDSLPARGAQTASGSVHHTYAETGTFTVRGRAEDVVEGFAEAQVEVEILP